MAGPAPEDRDRTSPAERRALFERSASAGLFVGVSAFEDERLAEVPFAVDDAVDLAHTFALELGLIAPERSVLLLAGEPKKASSAASLQELIKGGARLHKARMPDIYRHLGELARSTEPQGLFILTVATHGLSDQGGDFLVASDSLRERALRTGIAVSEVFDEVARAGAGCRLVLLDACRERLSQGTRGGKDSAMAKSFAEAIAHASGLVVVSGATLGGFAYDDFERENGVFTAAILDGLRGEAAPGPEGWITARTLADFCQQRVVAWVRRNRPDHATISLGIARRIEATAENLPLAPHPQATLERLLYRERREAALARVKENQGKILGGAHWDLVVSQLPEEGAKPAASRLLEEVEALDGSERTQRSLRDFLLEQSEGGVHSGQKARVERTQLPVGGKSIGRDGESAHPHGLGEKRVVAHRSGGSLPKPGSGEAPNNPTSEESRVPETDSARPKALRPRSAPSPARLGVSILQVLFKRVRPAIPSRRRLAFLGALAVGILGAIATLVWLYKYSLNPIRSKASLPANALLPAQAGREMVAAATYREEIQTLQHLESLQSRGRTVLLSLLCIRIREYLRLERLTLNEEGGSIEGQAVETVAITRFLGDLNRDRRIRFSVLEDAEMSSEGPYWFRLSFEGGSSLAPSSSVTTAAERNRSLRRLSANGQASDLERWIRASAGTRHLEVRELAQRQGGRTTFRFEVIYFSLRVGANSTRDLFFLLDQLSRASQLVVVRDLEITSTRSGIEARLGLECPVWKRGVTPPAAGLAESAPSDQDGSFCRPEFGLFHLDWKSRAEGARPSLIAVPSLLIDDLRLLAIMQTRKGFVAEVRGITQMRSYLLKEGDQLFDGTVSSISEEAVIFQQVVNDPSVLKPFQKVELSLKGLDSNGSQTDVPHG